MSIRALLVVHMPLPITAAVLLCSQASAQDTLIIQAVAQPVADEAKPDAQKDDAEKDDTKKDKPAEAAKDNKDKKPTDKPAKDAEADAKKRNAAERRKALVQRKVGPAAAQNTIEQQMHKQLEPMLKTEISFAARAAELKDDERRALIIAAKKWFDGFVTDFVKNQDPNQQQMLLQGGQMMWFGGPQRKIVDPREAIRSGLQKVATSTLSKEKAQAYADESKKREEFIRKVGIDNLVARIDEKVDLSADQRKKITESLTAQTDKAKQPQLEIFAMNNGNMWPGASKEAVLPELTAAQKTVFGRLNSAAGQAFFGGNMFNIQGAQIDDVDLDVAEPAQDDKSNEAANTDSKSP
jgi:hypothetical protein